ncbi:MAG: diaminopimelate epimerase, partial [bacterium]
WPHAAEEHGLARASRTVPYISKVTGVPMVDLASRIMLGAKLPALGYGTGLWRTPPYYAVKVPVFSFGKLTDANSILGPEMKSTGEVLGLGRTLGEALFKGLTAAGFTVPEQHSGVLLSVDAHDYMEILPLARRFYDLGLELYATPGTAQAVSRLGLRVQDVETEAVPALMQSGHLSYIVYTGAVKDGTMGDYIALHRRAIELGIPCLTSLDTAAALADMIESRFTAENTELVDICRLRTRRQRLSFTKMQDAGNDYIVLENFDGSVTCPESLCVSLCRAHYGVGADGIVLLEKSSVADVRMRSFNRDGSEGRMAGNNLRFVGKYMADKGLISGDTLTVETAGGLRALRLYRRDGRVSSVTVSMGAPAFAPEAVPCDPALTKPLRVLDENWEVTCLSVGNPHCVTFVEAPETLPLETLGPAFEHHPAFPERVNAEFVRVVTRTSLRMRVWERGSGETLACGTGACAAVVAAVEKGLCDRGADIRVSLPGGDLTVTYDSAVSLTGGAEVVFEGTVEL